MSQQKLIQIGIEKLGLANSESLSNSLDGFVDSLLKWNKTFNLTAITEKNQIISHHLMDSLSVSSYLHGENIIDVGSGGGFPGIPLALCFPEKNFTLLDSNGKKTRFLRQMTIELNLSNCEVVQSRAEAHVASYDTVICRAFASLKDICEKVDHLLAEDGQILAMKGRIEPEELSRLYGGFEISNTYKLKVPSVKADRHLIILKKSAHS